MRVEVAVLRPPSLISPTLSVGVKQHSTNPECAEVKLKLHDDDDVELDVLGCRVDRSR